MYIFCHMFLKVKNKSAMFCQTVNVLNNGAPLRFFCVLEYFHFYFLLEYAKARSKITSACMLQMLTRGIGLKGGFPFKVQFLFKRINVADLCLFYSGPSKHVTPNHWLATLSWAALWLFQRSSHNSHKCQPTLQLTSVVCFKYKCIFFCPRAHTCCALVAICLVILFYWIDPSLQFRCH